jgi:hypothetical protein
MQHSPTRKTELCGLILLHCISPVLSSGSVSHCHFTVSVLPKNSGWEFVAADQNDEGLHRRIFGSARNLETGLLHDITSRCGTTVRSLRSICHASKARILH